MAYLLTRDRGQAEDLLQTSLAKAWPAWGRISDPEAYVRRVMVTTYSSWWRRKWNGEVPIEELPEHITADPHSDVDAGEPSKQSTAGLPGAHVIVGFSISVPWEEYAFPPEQPIRSPDAVLARLMGTPFIASASDPTQRRSATYEWRKTELIMVRAGAPIDLSVLVDGRPYATCRSWEYRDLACSFDLGPDSREPHIGFAPALGSRVEVTIVPLHASHAWAVYTTGSIPRS